MSKIVHMLSFCTVILGIAASGCPLRAQSLEELEKMVREVKACYEKVSMPDAHSSTYTLSSGKTVQVLEQSDYQREAFATIDSFIDNFDLIQNSLFFTDKRKTLMDAQDLSDWEVAGIRTISNEYFKNAGREFHLACHGLLDSSGERSDCILMGGQYLDVKEAAELIIKSMEAPSLDFGYQELLNAEHKPFTIVLHSCNSAKGSDSFAAKLSSELRAYLDQVAVVASPDVVYCTEDFAGNYTERIASEASLQLDRYKTEAQNWLVFENGKMVMTGTEDYATTVKQYTTQFYGL